MKQHHRSAPHTVLMVAIALGAIGVHTAAAGRDGLPDRLSNHEFWQLTEALSEPDGAFRSDNLLSNEMVFARVLPHVADVAPGGVYLGVGPEQNFTYMAATRPKIAFIVDIRRGNLHAQLMYKALFDLAVDRADFVARLFTKTRPAGLTRQSTPREILDAYWNLPSGSDAEFRRNLAGIVDVLTRKYDLPLSREDRDGIEYVYHAFYWFGPGITWSSSASGSSGGRATYKDLMLQTDAAGQYLSYLGNEARFAFVQDLQRRNLIVPVVGNFAGPKAIRAIGDYVRGRDATVSVFYLSNVEQYLRQDGLWTTFCENVAALPVDGESVFIRPSGSGMRLTTAFASRVAGPSSRRVSLVGPGFAASPVMPILPETRACGGEGGPAPVVGR
jgi:hypothetical protein